LCPKRLSRRLEGPAHAAWRIDPGFLLFRPETDLKAYAASIRRLAALAPQIKMVLGAHNIPVAPPSVLLDLVSAFELVQRGKIPASPASHGQVIYKVKDISFLMNDSKSMH